MEGGALEWGIFFRECIWCFYWFLESKKNSTRVFLKKSFLGIFGEVGRIVEEPVE